MAFDVGHEGENLPRILLPEEKQKLEYQNSRSMSTFTKNKLRKDTRSNWNKFYRRNKDHFFKDRHWLLVEFPGLVDIARASLRPGGCLQPVESHAQNGTIFWLEVGCGVGNLIFPLFADMPEDVARHLVVYGCDFSSESIRLVQENGLFDAERVKPVVCDFTKDDLVLLTDGAKFDIVSVIFMLSALQPDQMLDCLKNISRSMRAEAVLVFRDYGVTDYAMVRFGPDTKLADRHYARQDGTLSYFFYADEVTKMFRQAGFEDGDCDYVHRMTENKREDLKVSRVFVQGTFRLKNPLMC